VFLTGLELALPVVTKEQKISVWYTSGSMLLPGGLVLKEAVLILHAFLNLGTIARLLNRPAVPKLIVLYGIFWLFGLLSALLNLRPRDIPEAFRFVAMAYFYLAIFSAWRPEFVSVMIRTFYAGLTVSLALNVHLSITNPRAMLGFLPLLYGQNGPGGFAGFFLAAAYLAREAFRSKQERMLLISFCVLAVFTLIISYSKLGLLMGIMALSMWFGPAVWAGITRPMPAIVMLILVVTLVVKGTSIIPESARQQAATIYEFKFENDGQGIFDSADMERWGYFIGVAEVFYLNPLGVSYTGIGRALEKTAASRKDLLAEEEDVEAANPHNSVLYYAAANGVPGILACMGFSLFFLQVVWRHIRRYSDLPRWNLFFFSAICVLFANTLPSFFNAFSIELFLLYMLSKRREWEAGTDENRVVSQAMAPVDSLFYRRAT
jgi:hypothetical protein